MLHSSVNAVSQEIRSGDGMEQRAAAPPKQVVGCSKSGLRVSLAEHGGQLILRGTADPMLLYLTIGAALGLGLLASIIRSPAQGIMSSLVFSALFSPILLFLIYSTLRLRTRCVISKAQGTVFVSERSYTDESSFSIPLADLTAVVLTARSQLPIVGGPEIYSIYLETAESRYLVLAGHDEVGVRRVADRLTSALKLPLVEIGLEEPDGTVRVPARLLLGTAALYLAPPLIAIIAIYLAFHDTPPPGRLMITSVGGIVLSQLGAILAFGYFRSHEPRDG